MPNWTSRALPPDTAMAGRYCRLEPYDPDRHSRELFEAFREDDGRMWTYLPWGPPASLDDFRTMMARLCLGVQATFQCFVIVAEGRALGHASYLRADPAVGSIEVGGIAYSPRLQRGVAATEAMYLMMTRVFGELGYRRYEWKCDDLNALSRRAAARLGFRFEGVFRQATIYKGRSRDTAWFSILDTEWPKLSEAFELWLSPTNFDAAGRQRRALSELTRELVSDCSRNTAQA
jgi:RimJ/RimL family protein N-acetyltransferase